MSRLPVPGDDAGNWGDILNDFLLQSHDASGGIKTSSLPDATASSKGVVRLAGDLGGSAAAPVIANGAITGAKIANTTISDANIAGSAAIAQSKIAGLTTDLSSKLTASNNLSDLANAATARTNLSVPRASGFVNITVSTTAPSNPAVGDVWIDTN